VAVSPDGHTLATGSDDATVQLWDLTDPAHPTPLGQPLTGHTNAVTSVAFSPDGHTLASASSDHTIRLWNLTDPTHPTPLGQPLTGHTSAVFSLAFSPDGHTLASGGFDDTVRLWNLADPTHAAPVGEPVRSPNSPVSSVAFRPDGHTLASGGFDGTVRLWPTPSDATVANLCSKLTSNISYHQWHNWISPTIGYITLCPHLPIATDTASLGVQVATGSRAAKIVAVTAGGPAAAAGLHNGAVITKADDHSIDSADGLVAVVKSKAPGDKMTLTYTDPSGANRTVEVTLGSAAGN